MPFYIYSGKTGAGKSLILSRKIASVFKKNLRYFKKSGIIRRIYTNMPINLDMYPDCAPAFFRYFHSLHDTIGWFDGDKYKEREVINTPDIDIAFDEISIPFDSQNWKTTDEQEKAWIKQHRKKGLRIWSTTQDFNMVDINVRRVTDKLVWLKKIFGSRDVSATRPDPKIVWGIILKYPIESRDYAEDTPIRELSKGFPSILFFSQYDVDLYDTSYIIEPQNKGRLRHIEKTCPVCGEEKVIHV